jgi:hypothetical protein
MDRRDFLLVAATAWPATIPLVGAAEVTPPKDRPLRSATVRFALLHDSVPGIDPVRRLARWQDQWLRIDRTAPAPQVIVLPDAGLAGPYGSVVATLPALRQWAQQQSMHIVAPDGAGATLVKPDGQSLRLSPFHGRESDVVRTDIGNWACAASAEPAPAAQEIARAGGEWLITTRAPAHDAALPLVWLQLGNAGESPPPGCPDLLGTVGARCSAAQGPDDAQVLRSQGSAAQWLIGEAPVAAIRRARHRT